MIPAFSRPWLILAVGLAWFFLLLWPLLGIHADGTLTFDKSFQVWIRVAVAAAIFVGLRQLNKAGAFNYITRPLAKVRESGQSAAGLIPKPVWILLALAVALAYPQFTGRYAQDVAVSVLVYVCLGLGLNVVVGLAGLLDLGYIAFYGVGAYTYALLSVHYGVPFWLCLPIAAMLASLAGCIIGYPTLRMRGDYLAIVTLGFGEIIRIILNNWMELTNGPNGILGIEAPSMIVPDFEDGLGFEFISLRKLQYLYYVVLFLAVFTIVAVHRLNFSRIGRAWEAIREDETAAELMGVNTFLLKLLAYAMGAVFGGLAGAFFAARMRFVSPESFTFLESAMVLAMVVLGGLGSIPGVILGALALVALPEIFRGFELYRMLAFGGAMTLMMLVRPAGLWPAKRMGRRSEEAE
ncbi:amino acid/amide ABC transporter membrane protein 2, HAAT family [Desulfocurvibacter africanus PCS]|uniref:Amino acid/amide ABC transporter membrane protein 2, HAAT family n=1 Tax=Desulfocurvibacter africanus PCS TaxID=1262666 RepID=M5Q015_DESAF|nr:high-affinity branched-chain amino acid ABC transporter permease LivM [Desulfocurvibacter africanus]EMG36316.1 amino acid/amide ABC transporter membrane protein 2, HAAT family [Desulfocurvibacter africanus PCS]